MLFAAAFTLEVRHATTLANGPADALSRRDRPDAGTYDRQRDASRTRLPRWSSGLLDNADYGLHLITDYDL